MPLLTWILLFSLLGGVLSVLAAAVFLLFPEQLRARLLPHFVSYAIGALLGAAFLALLPHASLTLQVRTITVGQVPLVVAATLTVRLLSQLSVAVTVAGAGTSARHW